MVKNNPYAKIFAIVKQINQAGSDVSYKDLVKEFTNGRTTSLKDLSTGEFEEFERSLVKLASTKKMQYQDDPLDKSRKAIISQFLSIGRTTAEAIAWVEKYGVFGKKKSFNDYNGQELYQLIKNAEKVKTDYIASVNRKL